LRGDKLKDILRQMSKGLRIAAPVIFIISILIMMNLTIAAIDQGRLIEAVALATASMGLMLYFIGWGLENSLWP